MTNDSQLDATPAGATARLPASQSNPALDACAPVTFDIQNLNVWFADLHVLRNVSLQIPSHAVTAIIGPSGCGKSTFLRCLNRMHDLVPSARVQGRITLFGQDLYTRDTDAAIVRRRVGMVFQQPNPFPTMSVADNVTAGLRLNGLRGKSLLRERMEHSLRLAALWDDVKDRLNSDASSLAVGEQQRLCIARALAVQPEVLLMDEPASALDPTTTAKIEDLILQLQRDYPIVIVTHNMQQAARISSRTAFFYQGELVEHDETNRLFTSPRQKQTEDYVTGRFG